MIFVTKVQTQWSLFPKFRYYRPLGRSTTRRAAWRRLLWQIHSRRVVHVHTIAQLLVRRDSWMNYDSLSFRRRPMPRRSHLVSKSKINPSSCDFVCFVCLLACWFVCATCFFKFRFSPIKKEINKQIKRIKCILNTTCVSKNEQSSTNAENWCWFRPMPSFWTSVCHRI